MSKKVSRGKERWQKKNELPRESDLPREKFDDAYVKQIQKLLGLRLGLLKTIDLKLVDDALLKDYLTEKYGIEIKNTSDAVKRMNGYSGYMSKEVAQKWRQFVTKERKLLITEINQNDPFTSQSNSFDKKSAENFIREMEKAKRCVFFNTPVNMDKWFSPDIQLHLCIQKSIEQKNNFQSYCACHKVGANADTITACHQTPPVYRHFRILFIPKTNAELLDKKSDPIFHETLNFFCASHAALSIQLAIFTVSDFVSLMKNNLTDFEGEDFLLSLGLDVDIKKYLNSHEGKDIEKLEELIRNGIHFQPDYNSAENERERGMDFMCMDPKDETGLVEVWGGYSKDPEGLSYFKYKDHNSEGFHKRRFYQILWKVISNIATQNINHKYKEFDFVHNYYAATGRKMPEDFFVFGHDYDAFAQIMLN